MTLKTWKGPIIRHTIKKKMNVKTSGFLESCFQYYQEHIFFSFDPKSKKEALFQKYSHLYHVTNGFGPIFIIDYPNIIHTLHDHYKNESIVIEHFYSFLYHQLVTNQAKVIIIVKNLVIDNTYNYSMLHVLQQGKKLTKKDLMEKKEEETSTNLFIYEIQYIPKISSSVDDLLGYFITLVLFSFLLQRGENPIKKEKKTGFQRLNILTNDAQKFDKNLFGVNLKEKTQTVILYFYQAHKTTHGLKKVRARKEESIFRHFLKLYVINQMYETAELSCFLIGIIKQLKLLEGATAKFLLSYETFVKKVQKLQPNLCVQPIHSLKESFSTHDSYYYYLYVLIKCVQATLFQKKIFGAVSKEEIVELVR
jgi:hypothetical protein